MMVKRLSLILTLSFLLALFGAASPSAAQVSPWTAIYYPNTSFTNPIPTPYTYNTLNLNFGTGVPKDAAGNDIPGMPADNFSARFSSVQNLPSGNYIFTLRVDDRANVRLNGVQIFSRTEPGTDAAQVFLPGGNVTMEVDYIEFFADAFIELVWQPVGGVPGQPGQPGQPGFFPTVGPTPTPEPTARPTFTALPPIPPGALTATVIRAGVLNIRNAPTTGGDVIGRILRGQTYAIVGRDQNARWFLLQLGGYQGWANGYYLGFNTNEFNAPITSGNTLFINPPAVPDFGVRAQTQAGLRLRAAPTTASQQIGRINWGAFLPVIGRTANGQWWKVVWRGTVGWVASGFAIIVEGDIRNVPIE